MLGMLPVLGFADDYSVTKSGGAETPIDNGGYNPAETGGNPQTQYFPNTGMGPDPFTASQPQAGSASNPPRTVTQNPTVAPVIPKLPGGVGIRFTNAGLVLSDGSTIKWPVIGLGVAAIFLLQSSGFEKKK